MKAQTMLAVAPDDLELQWFAKQLNRAAWGRGAITVEVRSGTSRNNGFSYRRRHRCLKQHLPRTVHCN
jgi:hypothetical protein